MANGTNSAKIVTVIETRSCKGNGTEKDPCREVIQFWDFEGNMLAENDTWNGWEDEESKADKVEEDALIKYLRERGHL